MRQTARVLEVARAHGLPVPRHDLVTELSDGYVAVVQERLPGRQVAEVTPNVVDAFAEMSERFTGLLADHRDVARPAAFPDVGRNDYGWGDTIGGRGDRGRRLLRRLLAVDGGRPFQMTGDDLVHTDYSLENVLFNERGRISGIVDWNQGAVRGDHRYALIPRLGVHEHPVVQVAGLDRLDQVLDRFDPQLLRVYLAHSNVFHVHHAISHRLGDARIEDDMRAAEHFLDGVE
jgi:aminoglycoside phosphotransferase (APT) family kinase protein